MIDIVLLVCQISLEMLSLRLFLAVLPRVCVSIPAKLSIGMLSARMDSLKAGNVSVIMA